MKILHICLTLSLFIFADSDVLRAQSQLVKDYSYVMEIPSIVAIESSPAHVYILSETEGMVVFRTQGDSLQWLYSSTGMTNRGDVITTDIRFAYLFGRNDRLTVLEPTSVLGVYSATLLPQKPVDSKRIDQHLYVALSSGGIGKISLSTPSAVDSTVNMVAESHLENENIIDLEATDSQLFALTKSHKLLLLKKAEDSLNLSKELSLQKELNRIFLIKNSLYGSDREGNIYEVDRDGNLARMGTISEPVKKIQKWKNWLLVQGTSSRIWTSYQNQAFNLWKDDGEAGNYFTVSQDQLWLSEYNQVSRIISGHRQSKQQNNNRRAEIAGDLKLEPIHNRSLPYPKPLLLPIKLKFDFPVKQVQFAYQSDITTAKIRGNGFYWQPGPNDIGQHRVKIIATASNGQTDSISFTIDVRSFNSPPRFTPLRPITIPVGQPFALPVRALDPDGNKQNLVRYLGVDLPEGSTIDEQSGEFEWTPTSRQIGKNSFRVIATDQYGAASSVDVSIRVIETERNSNGGGD